MPKYPQTLDELKAQGYQSSGNGKCRNCGKDMAWFTTPRGKKIPMNPMQKGGDKAVPHWETCENRQ